jgi:hypothetical protein
MPENLRQSLPPGLRARAYAGAELVIALCDAARKLVPFDLETVLIHFCVSEATMRPLLLGPHAPLHLIDEPLPPQDLRGWISRRAIADRTGLARETVRRKALALIEAGLLEEDSKGRLRSARNLGQPEVQAAVEAAETAVRRYGALCTITPQTG